MGDGDTQTEDGAQTPTRLTEARPRLLFSRLRFADDVEPSFQDYYFEQSKPFVRLAIVLAAVLYALFGILDLFIVPEVASEIWFIRYAIFCPAAVLVLAITWTRWFESMMQPILAGFAMICGLGIVAMIAVADAEGGYLYYAGLLLVLPWSYAVLRLRFWYATLAATVVVAGYEIVAVFVKNTPLEILLNNNFFFISSTIIGMVAGYTIERGIRTDFLQRRLIESQREELADHNVQLDSALQQTLDEVRRQAAEIQASRARIVAAANGERRRIERNLHDGAQQHLVALGVRLGVASKMLERDPAAAAGLLEGLREQVHTTIEEIRTLAHGIYPPLLKDQGLKAALEAAAGRSTLPASVEADSLSRYPTEMEATIYFCCLEAIQNACKYAGEGSTIRVSVKDGSDRLEFEVRDDGVGFDPGSKGLGAGFVNMSDRLGVFGGTLEVESAPGRGTKVAGVVPLDSESRDVVVLPDEHTDDSEEHNVIVLTET